MTIRASVGKHLAFAPVAFAVTQGPSHALLYANTIFRRLQSTGKIVIGRDGSTGAESLSADLMPLLDQVFNSGMTVRDALLEPADHRATSWSCTVWPVTDAHDIPEKLVIEVRDVALLEGAMVRQRAIAERLLLGALREQDAARSAVDATERAQYLARASHDLSMSLDEHATRDTVRRLALPRLGTWCIVDVIESNGAVHRLAVVHPDPAKQVLARRLEALWPSVSPDESDSASMLRWQQPTIVTRESDVELMAAAHGPENLRLLHDIGFGSLLVVPLIVRARLQGAITFVSPEGDLPFTSDEIALAADVAARCAMALDNARLYREADALRLAAELANQTKSQFLGSMSHELRTPLNAIGGYADLIEMGLQGPVTDAQQSALARIKANQQHLIALITEILNFVRVESGRMEYIKTQVSMTKALVDVAEMLGVAAADRGLTVDGPWCASPAMAWADSDRVRQILVNVMMNAVKYTTRDGGTISLDCEEVGDTVLAHIADTGRGIPPEKLEAIFDPFVQLPASLADRQDGVGLGLAISRDLARAMDGDLTVDSTVGVGSRFTLALPRAPVD
ncbi:MAG: HAMP domain-containing sensor histidine kinase [bacterium]